MLSSHTTALCLAILIFTTCLGHGQATDGNITFKAWQQAHDGVLTFPELEGQDGGVQNKSNVGIAFTGGGSRAMIAALGQLGALSDLGLLKDSMFPFRLSLDFDALLTITTFVFHSQVHNRSLRWKLGYIACLVVHP